MPHSFDFLGEPPDDLWRVKLGERCWLCGRRGAGSRYVQGRDGQKVAACEVCYSLDAFGKGRLQGDYWAGILPRQAVPAVIRKCGCWAILNADPAIGNMTEVAAAPCHGHVQELLLHVTTFSRQARRAAARLWADEPRGKKRFVRLLITAGIEEVTMVPGKQSTTVES